MEKRRPKGFHRHLGTPLYIRPCLKYAAHCCGLDDSAVVMLYSNVVEGNVNKLQIYINSAAMQSDAS